MADPNRSVSLCALVPALFCTAAAFAAQPEPKAIFAEAAAICQRDGGQLWGHTLCGPILLGDPAARRLIANQADAEGQLKEQDGVWVGAIPASMNGANTSLRWAGVRWTMLVLPLPEDPHQRAQLLAHEMFHRIQDQLGLAMANPANAHLDSLDGRYWLRLEMRALEAALALSGTERTRAIANALAFRAERWRIFPQAAVEEPALERNEGTAEYTGLRLSGRAPQEQLAGAREQLRADRPSFVRSFAYATGPAYGLLLDALEPDWKSRLNTGKSLSALLRDAVDKTGATGTASATGRAAAYDGAALRSEETARARAMEEWRARYRARLVDGPKLTLRHGQKMSIGFNPGNLLPLGELGTVYPTLRLSDEWGVLEVTDGALLSADWSHTDVAAPEPKPDAKPAGTGPIAGPGWTLTLTPGWALTPGARSGDLVVARLPATSR
jgi:hypothetical protein